MKKYIPLFLLLVIPLFSQQPIDWQTECRKANVSLEEAQKMIGKYALYVQQLETENRTLRAQTNQLVEDLKKITTLDGLTEMLGKYGIESAIGKGE